MCLDFNPRSREGSDLRQIYFPLRFKYFNPRSREGSDEKFKEFPLSVEIFQSTLPRRERLYVQALLSRVHRFQSTLPRRERQQNYTKKYLFSLNYNTVFIISTLFFINTFINFCLLVFFPSAKTSNFFCSLALRTTIYSFQYI